MLLSRDLSAENLFVSGFRRERREGFLTALSCRKVRLLTPGRIADNYLKAIVKPLHGGRCAFIYG